MKAGLYPRIAADGIRRNARLYIPYFITCILMVAVFYITHFLAYSGILNDMPGGWTAGMILGFGPYVIGIFSAIFLFYTQSTLIKGRKKEFGLYSVLGMNKRNLGRIILYEMVLTWAAAMAGGLTAGIGLSKFAELGFTRMIDAPVDFTFRISGRSVLITMATFTAILFLIYLNTLRQIGFASAIELVASAKTGEKPPKANYFLGILGILITGAGYFIALRIKQPISAFIWFFIAVILVVIGTFLLLIAGSVLLCRLLQKNPKYYYRADHFVSVSSMAYRMKRNGAGLASICILLTMIFVTISSTSALYTNAEDCLSVRYPNDFRIYTGRYGYIDGSGEVAKRMKELITGTLDERGIEAGSFKDYSVYTIDGYFENDVLEADVSTMMNGYIDYDKVVEVEFMDADTYNAITGSSVAPAPGQAIAGTTDGVKVGDKITIGSLTFDITDSIDGRVEDIDSTASIAVSPVIYLIVNDAESVAMDLSSYTDYNGTPMIGWFWYCMFDTPLAASDEIQLASDLSDLMRQELAPMEIHFSCESRDGARSDFVSTYGGLFFLGILLSSIFLVSCVLIIYYKQISEGFEDRAGFEIMQKVGMTKKAIRKSINSLMLTVFLIPVVLACIHLAAALPIVHKLLMLLGLNNIPVLILTASVCVLVFGAFYAVIYKLTSNIYYKIVS